MNPNKLRVAALLAALAFVPLAGAQDKAKPAAPAAAKPPAAAPAAAGHTMITAKDIEWKDFPSIAGAKIAVLEGPMNEAVPLTFRIKVPAGGKIPPHWHPGIEHVTAISGHFAMAVGEKWDDKAMHTLGPGDMMILQAKTPHYAMAKDEAVVQVHGTGPWGITYVNPADDPKNKPTAAPKAEMKKDDKKK
jgi:quercetin dioxygenase-like cupin family protein